MERLRIQMAAMITEIPVSVVEGEDGGAAGEDMADFKDWLLVTFRGDYSRDIKSQLVEEFLREGSNKGALKTLDSYALPDPPAGRIIIVPVKRCRIKAGEWTSWRGEGLDARILPLAEAHRLAVHDLPHLPAAQSVSGPHAHSWRAFDARRRDAAGRRRPHGYCGSQVDTVHLAQGICTSAALRSDSCTNSAARFPCTCGAPHFQWRRCAFRSVSRWGA